MHRIAATPGGWNPGTEGVILLNKPWCILTADTDIQTLAAAVPYLGFSLQVANLLQLQQGIDTCKF